MEQLTPREMDALRLAELTNRQAALILHITYQAMKNLWKEVYKKLDVTVDRPKRTIAIMRALRLGYLRLDEVVPAERRER